MTTTAPRPPAWRLDRLIDRSRAALHLTITGLGLQGLAAVGDPVAQLLRGQPDDDRDAIHERIRARGPLAASRTGMIAITGHELCDTVLRDRRWGVRDANGRLVGQDPVTRAAAGRIAESFLDLDPPDHTRLRRIAAPAFRPRAVESYRDRIATTAHRLLDAVAVDQFDLMRDYAIPLPIAVISDLLGIPDVDTARFNRIGMLVGQSLDGVSSLQQADALREAGAELEALFTRLAAHRRHSPSDDVISTLVAAEDDGRMAADELLAVCGLLLVAGFETTVNLIGNAVAVLLTTPGLWSRLVSEPNLASAAVEETLRHTPPVQLTQRVAHEPIELAGRLLPTNTVLLLDLAAANRDPAVFTRPARFDLDRAPQAGHLAFGSGIHYCLGAPLARLEGEVALRVLAAKLPDLRTLPGARRRAGATIYGYRSLPVSGIGSPTSARSTG